MVRIRVRVNCEHGKSNNGYHCKECPGKGICEHRRIKSKCKECGGSAFCEHGRQKPKCRECGGSEICEHGRQKSQCKECGGSSICEHGREKSRCKECGGSGICEHGRRKSECKECGGSQICEHGRNKFICRECGGSRICEHGRNKSYCKECGGSAFCEHGRERRHCTECQPLEKLLKNKKFCNICGLTRVDGTTRTVCAQCDESAKTRMEYVTWEKIKDRLPPPTHDPYNQRALGGCNNEARKFPDVVWASLDRVIHLESRDLELSLIHI